MSATNHTTNYELPIFIGTDKPAWLVDWNGAMTAIDTAIHTAEGKADQAGTDIGGIESSISTINSTLTSINNAVSQLRIDTNANTGSINTITSLIGNGEPTTTDKTLIGAINELNAGQKNLFDFGLSKDVTVTPIVSGVTIPSGTARVKTFSNSEHSIGKIYGSVYMTFALSNPISSGTPFLRLNVPDLVTEEEYSIGGFYGFGFTASGISPITLLTTFKTDNTVEISPVGSSIGTNFTAMTLLMPPCLLFFKNLGDGE